MIAQLLVQAAAGSGDVSLGERIFTFIDTPAPFSPFSEYLIVLFVLWLIARRADRKPNTFDIQAQEVLDEKFEKGEISRQAYEKFRQQMELEAKR
ncbi:MAG TPA: hypothetical protein VK936_08360 [Longimicrobiales bacterium]|nr:hypothetical protein [Longimicrobiales bacterium]